MKPIEGYITLHMLIQEPEDSSNRLLKIHFAIADTKYNILGTPFFQKHINSINVQENTLNVQTLDLSNLIVPFHIDSQKEAPYISQLYRIISTKSLTVPPCSTRCLQFPLPHSLHFPQLENHKKLHRLHPWTRFHKKYNKFLNLTDISPTIGHDIATNKPRTIKTFHTMVENPYRRPRSLPHGHIG